MIKIKKNLINSLLMAVVSLSTVAFASDWNKSEVKEPTHDKGGSVSHKYSHRVSPMAYAGNPFGSQNRVLIAKEPPQGNTAAALSPITYHGGEIMSNVSKVVIIWYGNWNQNNGTDTPEGKQVIRDLVYGLAIQDKISNYSGITTGFSSNLGSYTQKDGASVKQASSTIINEFAQAASPTYGGKTLTDETVWALVRRAAGTGDSNAIYMVLSSSDIAESSGFLTEYCGWHSYGAINKKWIKYGFVGNPKNNSACVIQSTSPNGNAGADSMASTLAHELVETVSNPQLNAWYNSEGYENSDMCTWSFGHQTKRDIKGAYWNVSLSTPNGVGRRYLLQRQLSVKDSKCYINATGSNQ